MSIGSTTAKSGYTAEKLFAQLVNTNMSFNNSVKKFLKMPENSVLTATVIKGTEKGDVALTSANDVPLKVSIKKSTANFSQLDRRWLSSLESALDVPSDIVEKIQHGLDSMRLKQGTIQRLILPTHKNDIVNYFQNNINAFMNEMFTRQDSTVSLLVVYDSNADIWYLLQMSDVLTYTSALAVDVSNKGVLKFGDCITIQRKGGDGNITHIHKTDPTHPSNQIQTKIKPLKIVESLNPLKLKVE